MSDLTIKSDNQFHETLSSYRVAQATLSQQAHTLACYAVVHALKHGNTDRVNSFFSVLSKSQQPAFKRWVVKHCASDVKDLSTSFLTMKKGEFVINDKVPFSERSLYSSHLEKAVVDGLEVTTNTQVKLSNPEELETLPCFFEIDSDKVKNPFTNETLLKSIKSLITRAEKSEDVKQSNVLVLKELYNKLAA